VPLIRVIRAGLERAADGCLQAGLFRDILRRSFGEGEATEQIEIAAQWGRYAELFEYDAKAQQSASSGRREGASRAPLEPETGGVPSQGCHEENVKVAARDSDHFGWKLATIATTGGGEADARRRHTP
jgi:hypothetical protein